MYSMYEISVESNFRPVLYPIFGIPFIRIPIANGFGSLYVDSSEYAL